MLMNKLLKLIHILIFAGAISCHTKNQVTQMDKKDKFTWNIQLAMYELNQYDYKGETSYAKFIFEFDKFPWLEQLDKMDYKRDGCSPTLSVQDNLTTTNLWVSMQGTRNDNSYLIGYVYPKIKKTLFGFGPEKTINWLEIYETSDKEIIKECFALFFDRENQKLENTLETLNEFGQMEPQS